MLILWNKQWLRKGEKPAGLCMKQINSCWRFTLLKKLNCPLPNQYSSWHVISFYFFPKSVSCWSPLIFLSTVLKTAVWSSSFCVALRSSTADQFAYHSVCLGKYTVLSSHHSFVSLLSPLPRRLPGDSKSTYFLHFVDPVAQGIRLFSLH